MTKTTINPTKRLLGQILIDGRFITRRILSSALLDQKKTGRPLGEILVRKGAIHDDDLAVALSLQRDLAALDGAINLYSSDRLKIGEILVTTGRITRPQLDEALSKQKTKRKKLGEILVELGYLKSRELKNSLSLQKKITAALFAATFSLASLIKVQGLSPDITSAKAVSGAVSVSATVKGHTAMKVINQSPELTIKYLDSLKGYVDSPSASTLEVKTNGKYMIVFEIDQGSEGLFKAVEVEGLGRKVEIADSGGWIVQPYPGNEPAMINLGYRFILADDAEPGTYNWPLKVSVKPI